MNASPHPPAHVPELEAQDVEGHAAREDVRRNAETANDLVEWWILYSAYDDVHGASAGVVGRIDETITRRRLMLGVRPAA